MLPCHLVESQVIIKPLTWRAKAGGDQSSPPSWPQTNWGPNICNCLLLYDNHIVNLSSCNTLETFNLLRPSVPICKLYFFLPIKPAGLLVLYIMNFAWIVIIDFFEKKIIKLLLLVHYVKYLTPCFFWQFELYGQWWWDCLPAIIGSRGNPLSIPVLEKVEEAIDQVCLLQLPTPFLGPDWGWSRKISHRR